jgi:hypothetical protein
VNAQDARCWCTTQTQTCGADAAMIVVCGLGSLDAVLCTIGFLLFRPRRRGGGLWGRSAVLSAAAVSLLRDVEMPTRTGGVPPFAFP